jgi:hypothetical protein
MTRHCLASTVRLPQRSHLALPQILTRVGGTDRAASTGLCTGSVWVDSLGVKPRARGDATVLFMKLVILSWYEVIYVKLYMPARKDSGNRDN